MVISLSREISGSILISLRTALISELIKGCTLVVCRGNTYTPLSDRRLYQVSLFLFVLFCFFMFCFFFPLRGAGMTVVTAPFVHLIENESQGCVYRPRDCVACLRLHRDGPCEGCIVQQR